MTPRKVDEWTGEIHAYRLLVDVRNDAPMCYVRLEHRENGGPWDLVGRAELHPVAACCTREGLLETSGTVAEWSDGWSYRRSNLRRLTVRQRPDDSLDVVYQRASRDPYRDDDDDVDEWTTVDRYRLGPDGATEVSGGVEA